MKDIDVKVFFVQKCTVREVIRVKLKGKPASRSPDNDYGNYHIVRF